MKTIPDILKVFQHDDAYFESLGDTELSRTLVLKQSLVIFLFTLLYGLVMGSYNGWQQCLVTAIKVPCLIFLSLLICFPALYVIQYMIGSKMTVYQMSNTILSGFVVFATITLSFAPIVIFFMITTDNYAFLKLLHVAIFTFSGIFLVRTIISSLTFSCEKKNIYPKLGMNVFKIWIIIFAFVSSQLAWNLRPFIGSNDLPFELFRERQSNFYIAVLQSAMNIFEPEQKNNKSEQNSQNGNTGNNENGQQR